MLTLATANGAQSSHQVNGLIAKKQTVCHSRGCDSMPSEAYDVAIIGGGPAGLSAALVLARSCRRIVACDHGHPRNYAAQAVHGYLGSDGISPSGLRSLGINECRAYGVQFIDAKVRTATCDGKTVRSRFQLELENGQFLIARKLLLATGVLDILPKIHGFADFYGTTIHHCPYCDGWEHRDKRLVALGCGEAAGKLALTLIGWSPHVTCCTNDRTLGNSIADRLKKYQIGVRSELITEFAGDGDILQEVRFADGKFLKCDALFFSAEQSQRSQLPVMLGCECDDDGLIVKHEKQGAGVRGLFLAGDADGEVQFAIVAAAEGAVAATAINAELLAEDFP